MNDLTHVMLSFKRAVKAQRAHRNKLSVYYFQEAVFYLGRVF